MNRTSDRKKVSRECPICGETMEMDPWAITLSNKHYEQTHLEYQKWLKRWTRELLLIGLLGVLTLALSLGLFFPCGITCQSNPFEWVGFYELLAYTGVMGLLVFQYRQGLRRFERDWREGQGIVQTFGNTSEDEQILHLTGELCHQLNTPKLVPKKILWKDVVQVPIAETSANIEMPSDLVSTGNGNIVLPKRMQGVLTLGVALFVITGRYFSPEARQELLRADQKAAELYGKDTFVRALQKIDRMGFADVQKLEKKKKRSMYDKPSVAERLENLE